MFNLPTPSSTFVTSLRPHFCLMCGNNCPDSRNHYIFCPTIHSLLRQFHRLWVRDFQPHFPDRLVAHIHHLQEESLNFFLNAFVDHVPSLPSHAYLALIRCHSLYNAHHSTTFCRRRFTRDISTTRIPIVSQHPCRLRLIPANLVSRILHEIPSSCVVVESFASLPANFTGWSYIYPRDLHAQLIGEFQWRSSCDGRSILFLFWFRQCSALLRDIISIFQKCTLPTSFYIAISPVLLPLVANCRHKSLITFNSFSIVQLFTPNFTFHT